MTYIVLEDCIKCKYTDCVTVCPVDCFYEGEDMLVINPAECIDCGVCVPECPIGAIKEQEFDEISVKWMKINADMSKIWPRITKQKEPLPDAEYFKGKPGKIKYLGLGE